MEAQSPTPLSTHSVGCDSIPPLAIFSPLLHLPLEVRLEIYRRSLDLCTIVGQEELNRTSNGWYSCRSYDPTDRSL